ncbi:ComEA family DNA-binding protein [Cohnella sp. 56]|uniref:ComEA family DNA-binding protein n=1 Tax=Cohnella sp. 56 TaxID=3113722 RepID=UPI0030E9F21D
MRTGMAGGGMRSRAAVLAGAAAAVLLAWGWMKPADGEVPGWQPVNQPLAAAVAAVAAPAAAEAGVSVTVPAAAGADKAPAGSANPAASDEAAPKADSPPPVPPAAAAGQAQAPSAAAAPSSAAAPGVQAASGLLDINTATAAELDELPGIGAAKAAAIIAYREAHGRFGSAEELKRVKGIGDKLLDKLRPLVTAG